MKTSGFKGKKESKRIGGILVTYPKLEQDKFGAPNKNGRMRVLFRFLAKINNAPMVENDVLFHIILPDESSKEDAMWFRDNVIRYVDIDNTGNDAVADMKADRLIERYNAIDPEGTHNMGIQILRYYAQEMYVRLSEWVIDNGE